MKKELEDIIYEMYAELNDSDRWYKKVSKLKQALTPPTADEIIKELNEWCEKAEFSVSGELWIEKDFCDYKIALFEGNIDFDSLDLPLKLAHKITSFFMEEAHNEK